MTSRKRAGEHAVVIGGSMAGLLCARALSEHFGRVSLFERDPLPDTPEARKGQPQARHLHAILARGLSHMTLAFPDLTEALRAGGALVRDAAETMHWHTYGDYRLPFTAGFEGATMSRPFLEQLIRERVRARDGVTLVDECSVEGFAADGPGQRLAGVQVTHRSRSLRETVEADLVIDASGRGSAAPRWLDAIGCEAPAEEHVKLNVTYATRLFRRDPDAANGTHWYMITGTPPTDTRAGIALPIEGNRWIATLIGIGNDRPPTDPEGFAEFAGTLAAPELHTLITGSEPLSEAVRHNFPSSRRRHYERLADLPGNLVVLGDSFASFNPIYGQGMTSAALQVAALEKLLERGQPSGGIARPFHRRAGRIIDRLWQLAVGEDFRFAETVGRKPPGTDLINAYVSRVHRASHHDPVVGRAFLRVMHVLAPPASLFRPAIVLRSLKPARRVPPVTGRIPAGGEAA